jgi:ribosomal protein L22
LPKSRFYSTPSHHHGTIGRHDDHGDQHGYNHKISTGENPILEEYLRKNPQEQGKTPDMETIRRQMEPEVGTLTSDSIFGETDVPAPEKPAEGEVLSTLKDRTPSSMMPSLDPIPERRQIWERKVLIRGIKRRGKLTRAEIIKRTEREISKRQTIKGSEKKLGPLARQIAGKNIDDAILQMRFSKKKAAKEVKMLLEHARDVAIVERGMGLGLSSEPNAASASAGHGAQTPINIELKSGKRHKIKNLTDIYVDQAWVGRADRKYSTEYRAKGGRNVLTHKWTRMSKL